MPQYCYKCELCGRKAVVFRPMADRNKPLPEFGHLHNMVRDILAEHGSVRGDYDKPIVAQSMSFDTVDLPEHRRRFPDVEVRTEGRIAVPVLRSLSQRRKYIKERGWVDTRSYF